MKISHATRTAVFDLLEQEKHVSYEGLALALGCSRPNAYRIAAQLLEEKRLVVRTAPHPVTNYRMRLLALAPMPSCMILDMHHSLDGIKGYYSNGYAVGSVTAAYQSMDGHPGEMAANRRRLESTLSLIWPEAQHATRLVWGEDIPRATVLTPPPLPCAQKRRALHYAISHHPDLASITSVLFIHMGSLLCATYAERDSVRDTWHEPWGDHCLTTHLRRFAWKSCTAETEKELLVHQYLSLLRKIQLFRRDPQLIIVEDEPAPYRRTPQPLRLTLELSRRPSERCQICHHVSMIPWWVYGELWRLRRERFLEDKTTES